jgi:hypothetical protein
MLQAVKIEPIDPKPKPLPHSPVRKIRGHFQKGKWEQQGGKPCSMKKDCGKEMI